VQWIEIEAYSYQDINMVYLIPKSRFQFDGMFHDPDKGLDHEYSQHSSEVTKTIIVQSLIPSSDTIPEGWLDNDERVRNDLPKPYRELL